MFVRRLMILGLVVAVCSGCRATSNDRCERAIALLRAEKLDLEDRYYELEAKMDSLSGHAYVVPGSRTGPTFLSPDSRGYPDSTSEYFEAEELPPGSQQPLPTNDSGNQRMPDEIPEIVIDTGDFSVVDDSFADFRNSQRISSSAQPTLNLPTPSALQPPPRTPVRQDRRVFSDRELADQISDLIVDYDLQNERQSNAWLILQPVDKDRRALPLVGEVVISIIDPDQPANQQRIGLWKYDQKQIKNWIHDRANEVPGIYVPIPAILKHRSPEGMIAFIRYTALNNQVFEVSFPLDNKIVQADGSPTSTSQRTASAIPADSNQANELDDDSTEWSPDR